MASKDVKQLLVQIKEGIEAVENGSYDAAVLSDIEADFLEMLELLKLFLISERDTYYGYFLMSMRFQVDFRSSGIAGIKLGEYPPVFISNPLLLCKFSLREIIYVVCHEIEHVVLNHPAEMLKSNPRKDERLFKLFNYAADASVNDRLDDETANGSDFMKAPEGVVNSRSLADIFNIPWLIPLENYRYYYDAIMNLNPDVDEPQPERMLSQFGEGDGSPDGGDDGGFAGEGDSEDDGIVTVKNRGELEDHDWGEDDSLDADEIGYAVREFVNSAVGLMSEESRGLMPASFMSQVEALNKPPKLSWQSILKKYVGTISAGKRKTRSRLNRRQPLRYDLSGSVDEKALKIVVAIDTSGSVDDEQVREILNEVLAIIAHRKFELTIIECDADIQRVYPVRSRADVKNGVQGRGGTAFTPVIRYVNNDRYFRDALLIYFTDGYGEEKIPRPHTYRNLWVITRGTYLSVEEPYGEVISMDGDVYD